MSNYFSDRKSTYPNRYKVTPASGSAYYATLERADEPTTVGTALNATVLNNLITNIANLHVWEEYPSEPHNYSRGEVEAMNVSTWGNTASSDKADYARYADDFAVAADGSATLENYSSVQVSGSGAQSYLRGKFVIFEKVSTTDVYYVPVDAKITATSTSSGGISTGGYATVDKVYLITPDENGEYKAPVSSGYVCDFDEGAYPSSGSQNGKWYLYRKKLGD